MTQLACLGLMADHVISRRTPRTLTSVHAYKYKHSCTRSGELNFF